MLSSKCPQVSRFVNNNIEAVALLSNCSPAPRSTLEALHCCCNKILKLVECVAEDSGEGTLCKMCAQLPISEGGMHDDASIFENYITIHCCLGFVLRL